MSNYAGFAAIANLIRGESSDEVIELFKCVADIATYLHQIKRTEHKKSTDTGTVHLLLQDAKVQMQTWRELQYWGGQLPRPHLVSHLDVASTLRLIYTHVDKIIGDPKQVLLIQEGQEVTEAEIWLVECVIHPDSNPDGDLFHLWAPYLVRQPEYEPNEDPAQQCEWQLFRVEHDGYTNYFPGLVQALRSFSSAHEIDEAGVSTVIQEFLALGATAVDIWTHIWQDHGFLQGQPLPEGDEHIQQALAIMKPMYTSWINDWKAVHPIHVRQELAEHNFGGDFLFLMNYVFPELISPSGSDIQESMFGWRMHRYIIEAATTPEVDPNGHIADFIRRQSWAPPPSNIPHLFFRAQSIRSYVFFGDLDFWGDVELEAYGSCIDIEDISEAPNQSPSDNTNCSICQYGFGSDPEELSPCVQLLVCQHLFHADCLEVWVNGVHLDTVQCPNCRARLCGARSRRPKSD
ncbi:hypothetical protein N0V83_003338 [Neocucurbitaria cava]|uniref:RING-type domain-containing protein n=1 Tax=Neocucurbitaria cava TaxID=798079 RepID=A0A9W8YBI7_9PLEO|nr:hypothetical protein N0V83_003338 [Neocucurbitaria cava]